jgi:hypothetical protein
MRTALLLALIAFAASADDLPRARDGRGRLPRGGLVTATSTGGPFSFCAQLQASDKAGNYDCVNGDGTQGAGSTHSFSAVGSPAVTAGTTCAAAAYTTMVAASNQSYRTPTFTASTGDQTICALVGATTAEGMWSVGEAGVAVIDQQGAVTHSAYANPAGGLCSASNSVPGDATPVLTCAIWDATAHQVTYFVGPNNVVNGSGCSGALSATTARVYFGCSALQSCASHSFGGKFFGGFWTGTKLSTARLTAINTLVTCQ